MEHGLLAKSPRIEVVDALRGFAVMAILLVHNLEHFIFPVYPADSPGWLNALDQGVFNVGKHCFFSFPGKLTRFSPCCSDSAFLFNITIRRRKVKTSVCVSCGGFSFCSLSAVSTGRFSPATY